MQEYLLVSKSSLRVISEACKVLSAKELADIMLQSCRTAPPDLCPDVTVGDLMPKEPGFDSALPLYLLETIKEEMDFDIRGHFVSDCRNGFKLYPITAIGRAVLPIIKRVIYKKGRNNHAEN